MRSPGPTDPCLEDDIKEDDKLQQKVTERKYWAPMDPRRRVSKDQERSVARRYGAKQHAGSGSGSKKHDMHTDESLIECKTVALRAIDRSLLRKTIGNR